MIEKNNNEKEKEIIKNLLASSYFYEFSKIYFADELKEIKHNQDKNYRLSEKSSIIYKKFNSINTNLPDLKLFSYILPNKEKWFSKTDYLYKFCVAIIKITDDDKNFKFANKNDNKILPNNRLIFNIKSENNNTDMEKIFNIVMEEFYSVYPIINFDFLYRYSNSAKSNIKKVFNIKSRTIQELYNDFKIHYKLNDHEEIMKYVKGFYGDAFMDLDTKNSYKNELNFFQNLLIEDSDNRESRILNKTYDYVFENNFTTVPNINEISILANFIFYNDVFNTLIINTIYFFILLNKKAKNKEDILKFIIDNLNIIKNNLPNKDIIEKNKDIRYDFGKLIIYYLFKKEYDSRDEIYKSVIEAINSGILNIEDNKIYSEYYNKDIDSKNMLFLRKSIYGDKKIHKKRFDENLKLCIDAADIISLISNRSIHHNSFIQMKSLYNALIINNNTYKTRTTKTIIKDLIEKYQLYKDNDFKINLDKEYSELYKDLSEYFKELENNPGTKEKLLFDFRDEIQFLHESINFEMYKTNDISLYYVEIKEIEMLLHDIVLSIIEKSNIINLNLIYKEKTSEIIEILNTSFEKFMYN